ncbi:MAG: aminotransferase class IV [Thermoleophilia bacterium]|nr:aminotransferase class IV [Thermoleophilia bacterium]
MNRVYLNSRLLPADKAMVPVFDRGFAYGDSLFETIKILKGRPVFLEEHLMRLGEGMKAAGFAGAPSLELLRDQAITLAQKNRVDAGRLRIQASRGVQPAPSGPDPAGELTPTWLVTVNEFGGFPPELYERGVACLTVPACRGRYASIKSAGLMNSILARREAHEAGAWEAILTDGQRRMMEGAYANIFFLAGGLLVTPPETDQILPGVIRGKVIEMAPGLGLSVQFHAPKMEELGLRETSAFLTGSLLGICAISEIDKMRLQPAPGAIAQMRLCLAEMEEAATGL